MSNPKYYGKKYDIYGGCSIYNAGMSKKAIFDISILREWQAAVGFVWKIIFVRVRIINEQYLN